MPQSPEVGKAKDNIGEPSTQLHRIRRNYEGLPPPGTSLCAGIRRVQDYIVSQPVSGS
jgi:hypothetical protein